MQTSGRAIAAGVHLFTALGAVVALLAARAVIAHDWESLFAWLGVALIIDGADGPLARSVNVTSRLPGFSGERLDWIIDYLTYVFIPAMALVEAGFLPGVGGLAVAGLVLTSSLYHFCDVGNKSDDGCFVGFPAIWNIVAFYCFALGFSSTLTIVLTVILVVLTFVPLKWVHPVRSRWLRSWTAVATLIWTVAAITAVATGLPASWPLQLILGAIAIYGITVSVAHGMAR